MPTLVNGKPIRVRGGKRQPSSKDINDLMRSDISRGNKSQLPRGASGASIFWMVAEVEETTRDHVVPRRSVTLAQHLKIWPTDPTMEDRLVRTFATPAHPVVTKIPIDITKTKTISKGTKIVNGQAIDQLVVVTDLETSPDNYAITTDSKLVKKGEKSLLLNGKPFPSIESEITKGQFKRLTSQSKQIRNERVNYSQVPDSLQIVTITKLVGDEELPVTPDTAIDTNVQVGMKTKSIRVTPRYDLADKTPARYQGQAIPKCKHGIFKVSCSTCKELNY